MDKKLDNEITVNKCVIGDTYYLDGMWYDYNFITFKHKPLINTPVKFIGKLDKGFKHNKGRHAFEMLNGKVIYLYAKDTMLLEPTANPEILEANASIKFKEKYG